MKKREPYLAGVKRRDEERIKNLSQYLKENPQGFSHHNKGTAVDTVFVEIGWLLRYLLYWIMDLVLWVPRQLASPRPQPLTEGEIAEKPKRKNDSPEMTLEQLLEDVEEEKEKRG